MEFIKFNGVTKQYRNGVTAIYDLNLKIKQGDFVFIIGGTGCGKSTLIKMLYREEKPTKGEIILGGIRVNKLRNSKVYKLRRKLGIVFQDYRLLPKANVYENVAFALEAIGVKKSEIRPKVLKAIELVGLKSKLRDYPDNLSGGEQQRVAIARALAKNPKLLLCDEPTGALDYNTGKAILKLLQDTCREQGMTVIIITHNLALTPMGDKIIEIKSGKVKRMSINENPVPVERIEG